MSEPTDLLRVLQKLERLGRSRPDRALAEAEALLRRAPGLVPLLCLAGRMARLTGDTDRARGHLNAALARDPSAGPALSERGLLAAAQGEMRVAAESFRRLVGVDDGNADGWYNLGLALERLCDWDAAADAYRRALELIPNERPAIRARIGGVLATAGREEAARLEYEQALAEDPSSLPANLGMGMLEAAGGDMEAALRRFRQCVGVDPRCGQAWQQIIESRRLENREDDDLVQMRRVLARDDLDDDSRERLCFALGKASDDVGAYEDAFVFYRQANELKRRRLPPFDRQAWMREVDRRLTDAEATGATASAGDRGGVVPVFIVGMPRSGTTLVDQILTSHTRVGGVGELPFFDQAAPADDTMLRQKYLECLGGEGAAVVTNKYPANFRHLPLLRRLFPDVRIVHVTRHPLDTCLSVYFQDFPVGNLYANSLGDIAAYYTGYRCLVDAWAGKDGGMLHVTYEGLLEDQEGVSRRLIEFCGLAWEAACLDFAANPRPAATLSRWQVRQPVYRRSVGRWKHYETQLAPLIQALGPLRD
ncbi:MAG: hypothetical protein AMJ59_23825 [Gammaproteobacteria bacterium SG8_31]|nr:MAG: hypothetical protein AMJ59_23825 [Gammaproteobacteria bacterium SG8_31]